MAYIKLNEVEIVESSTESNLLIEENGEIKRMPAKNLAAPQIQADWNETDATKSSFILNKPESLGGGSGKVVVYTGTSGSFTDSDGNSVSAQMFIDEWNAGSILRIDYEGFETNVIAVKPVYLTNSASGSLELSYATYVRFNGTAIVTETIR